MKHEKTIEKMMALYYENWMDDLDKETVRQAFLIECPMNKLDELIETGVKNGFSVERQIEEMERVAKEMA